MCGNIVLYALLAGTHTHIRVGMYTCETCMHARNLFMLTKHTSWLYMKVMGNVPENTPVWFLIYPSCTDPHCDWSMSIPGGHAKPMGVRVIAPGDGVACGGKFKRGCVSCCPSAEASINMIPIVLASVLIASGKNIWHSLILCVIVSVCLQVCLCEWVSEWVCLHISTQGAYTVQFLIEKKNYAVCAWCGNQTCSPASRTLPASRPSHNVYFLFIQPLGAAPHPLSPWLPVWSME